MFDYIYILSAFNENFAQISKVFIVNIGQSIFPPMKIAQKKITDAELVTDRADPLVF